MYESNNGEDIKVESSDGKAKVEIKNGSSNTTSSDIKINGEEMEKKVKEKIDQQKAEMKKRIETAKEKREERKKNFLEMLHERFLSFFTFSKSN